MHILLKVFGKLFAYPAGIMLGIIIVTFIFTSAYCILFGASFNKTYKSLLFFYFNIITTCFWVFYKLFKIPYEMIKIILSVFDKFKIFFYFIANFFSLFNSFLHDIFTVDI